jgi:hypothetical protein
MLGKPFVHKGLAELAGFRIRAENAGSDEEKLAHGLPPHGCPAKGD